MPTLIASANSVSYNKRAVLVSTVIGLVLSTGTYIARLSARRLSLQKFQWDDFMMGMALPFSYMDAVVLLYSLSVGLGEHVKKVSKPELRKFQIALFIFQRGNPPCLFCVKTSILILYARIFQINKFRKVCIVVWVYTLCWAIAAFFSNMLQCTPIAYQWDKTIPGGHCLPNALVTVGMTNGVLSFVGDVVILSLPIPMIWKLRINTRRKMALTGIFLLGGFVCLTSIFRFIALAQIDTKDITFTQVDPGVWTYMELAIGITSGNLPLLRPLFGGYFGGNSRNASAAQPYANSRSTGGLPKPNNIASNTRANGFDRDGFKIMDRGKNIVEVEGDVESQTGSEIELNNRKKINKESKDGVDVDAREWGSEGIRVRTEVAIDTMHVDNRVGNGDAKLGEGSGRRR